MPETIDAVRIAVSAEERSLGKLEAARFDAARQAMLDDGMVVLDDLVPVDIVDALGDRMAEDVPALVKSYEGRAQGFPGHLQQQPPDAPEHLHAEVLANPVILALCRSLLGPSIRTVLYTANTNMPGSVRQHVHCDLVQLWPDLDPVPRSPYSVVCNLSLIDTTPANAVELWPGTHLDGRTHSRDGRHREIPQAWVDARRAERPPVQVPQRKGSVLLRDTRLWHAGVPNTSGKVRVMVAMGYAPTWYAGFAMPPPPTAAAKLEELGVPAPANASRPTEWMRSVGYPAKGAQSG